jgi:hypothetical protein
MGQPPTHPQLLDWLAAELVEHDWSLKHIHRLMVTSATYRQAVRADGDPRTAKSQEVDSANELLWHARRRRLEGEAIRDAMLQISSQLNHRMLGPSARPRLPKGLSKRYAWKPDEDPDSHARRSIYVFVKRNMRFPIFDAFDLPDLHNSCGQRSSTTTAPQALLMLNSELSLELARAWAERLIAGCADDPYRVVSEAYLDGFGRHPTQDEITAGCQFLWQQSQVRKANSTQATALSLATSLENDFSPEAVTDFCHALFNANEFLFID